MKGNFGNGGVPSMTKLVKIEPRTCCWDNPLCCCLEFKPMENQDAKKPEEGPKEETRTDRPRENSDSGPSKKTKRGPTKRKVNKPSNRTMGFDWDHPERNQD